MVPPLSQSSQGLVAGDEVPRKAFSGGLPIPSRSAEAEASGLPIASRVAEAGRPKLGGGLPIPSRTAEAAAATALAPPTAKKGLPIPSRTAAAAAPSPAPSTKPAAPVVGATCGLPLRRRAAELPPANMVTTPLRRGARRRTRALATATPTGGLPRWAQACSPEGDRDGAISPMSHATAASATTANSLYVPALSRGASKSTTSSFPWAPQALVRSWHGRLSEMYSVVSIVGEGRSGAVFIVQHKRTEKYYACKILTKGDHDAEVLKGEIQTLRTLDHPNIVRLFETHEDGETVFLLMELCHGGDLFDKIADEQTLTEPIARIFARQMLSALAYCHSNGVVHRDIKPENFLLETEHPDCLTLKLADFGIATSIRPQVIASGVGGKEAPSNSGPWPSVADRGASDAALGSLPYMAPEMFRRDERKCYAAADLWSCGVTMYVMLCGSLPFGDCPDRICSGEAPDFSSEAWASVSEEAIDLLRRLLSPSPEARPTAQQALAHDWFSDTSPCEVVSPTAFSGLDDLAATDAASLHRLASLLLKNLRRWRQMPKLRRIAIAAIAKRLDSQLDAHRLAETAYTFFSDTPDTLRCERLVQVLNSTLCGSCSSADLRHSPSSLPGMMASPSRTFTRLNSGNSITGLHVRQRVKNTVKRIAGTPMASDLPSPEGQASVAELKNLVAALDGTKNGTVDYTLLVASMLPSEVYSNEQQIAEVFALFDVQRRGFVSPRDLRAAVRSTDADLRRFAEMVAQFDLNGDGVLDLAEFRAMVLGTG